MCCMKRIYRASRLLGCSIVQVGNRIVKHWSFNDYLCQMRKVSRQVACPKTGGTEDGVDLVQIKKRLAAQVSTMEKAVGLTADMHTCTRLVSSAWGLRREDMRWQ